MKKSHVAWRSSQTDIGPVIVGRSIPRYYPGYMRLFPPKPYTSQSSHSLYSSYPLRYFQSIALLKLLGYSMVAEECGLDGKTRKPLLLKDAGV
jgi:hypothetical protein